ncbi:hypothetical protein [Laspinema olomoucense]|nr:hypothetical protein [Laspinema sp. D3d]MCT7974332.1 hypothetical protein [Laspinema sp. D3d]
MNSFHGERRSPCLGGYLLSENPYQRAGAIALSKQSQGLIRPVVFRR